MLIQRSVPLQPIYLLRQKVCAIWISFAQEQVFIGGASRSRLILSTETPHLIMGGGVQEIFTLRFVKLPFDLG